LNNQFGKIVCNSLGFDSLGFIGIRNGYEKFMQDHFEENITFQDNESCIPEIVFSGAICDENSYESSFESTENLSGCIMKIYKTEGGTCIEGVSEVFMHCNIKMELETSEWNSWSTDTGHGSVFTESS
jgi:hypothetical protein